MRWLDNEKEHLQLSTSATILSTTAVHLVEMWDLFQSYWTLTKLSDFNWIWNKCDKQRSTRAFFKHFWMEIYLKLIENVFSLSTFSGNFGTFSVSVTTYVQRALAICMANIRVSSDYWTLIVQVLISLPIVHLPSWTKTCGSKSHTSHNQNHTKEIKPSWYEDFRTSQTSLLAFPLTMYLMDCSTIDDEQTRIKMIKHSVGLVFFR